MGVWCFLSCFVLFECSTDLREAATEQKRTAFRGGSRRGVGGLQPPVLRRNSTESKRSHALSRYATQNAGSSKHATYSLGTSLPVYASVIIIIIIIGTHTIWCKKKRERIVKEGK